MDDTNDPTTEAAASPTPPSSGARGPLPAADSSLPPQARLTTSLVAVVLFVGFVGGLAGYLVADVASDDDEARPERSRSTYQLPSSGGASGGDDDGERSKRLFDIGGSGDERGASIGDLYRDVSPAVVHITARIRSDQPSFFGIIPQEGEGTGSGFIVDAENGYVVTNAHVVENATAIEISIGEDVTLEAKVVGEDRSTDIAVLEFDADDEQIEGELSEVAFGDSSDLEVGDPVVAIGNPFGLDRTLTTGVVSALQRQIPALNNYAIRDAIQTDAAVNPGNSGGPLLNSAGEVVGVNSQISTQGGGFDGIAFAVASNTARTVVEDLIDDGAVEHAFLGITGDRLTRAAAKELGLEGDVVPGVAVLTVEEGSPADEAGLEDGRGGAVSDEVPFARGTDVIVEVNGQQVQSMQDVGLIVDASRPGDDLDLVVIRDGKRTELTATLVERPEDPTVDDG